jgi:hypothetical protein
MPAKAGHPSSLVREVNENLDSGLRRNDDKGRSPSTNSQPRGKKPRVLQLLS